MGMRLEVLKEKSNWSTFYFFFLPSEILVSPNPSVNPIFRPQGGFTKRRAPPFFSAKVDNAEISSWES